MWRLGSAPGVDGTNLNDGASSLPWVSGQLNTPPFDTTAYTNPTFGQAAYNMYFFGGSGLTAGEIYGYRIHYNEVHLTIIHVTYTLFSTPVAKWGPGPTSVGGNVPVQHGEVAQFQHKVAGQDHDAEPPYLAFVPDDYSMTYIVDGY
ncbi:hypothetical protein HK405_002272, partial [Cladochytrium tenue]